MENIMGEKSKVTSLVENEPGKNLGKVSDLFNFSIMSIYRLIMGADDQALCQTLFYVSWILGRYILANSL